MRRRDFIKCSAATAAGLSLANFYGFSEIYKSGADIRLIAQRRGNLDIVADVDLLVVGGSSAGVAAAVKAAQRGAKVLVIAAEPYLGYDICGMQRFWSLEDGEETAFRNSLLKDSVVPEPAFVKRMLQDYLIGQNIDFLLSTYASGVILDESGDIGGVVVVNRSGEQVIKARTVIDATDQAVVARLMGCSQRPGSGKKSQFRFTVVGNVPDKSLNYIVLPERVFAGKRYSVTEYRFESDVKTVTYDQLQKLEQSIRSKTWDVNQVDSSDMLFEIPANSILGIKRSPLRFNRIESLRPEDFRPRKSKRLFLLNGYADVDYRDKERLLLPGNMIAVGEMLGDYIGGNLDLFPANPVLHLKNRTGILEQGGLGIVNNRLSRPVFRKGRFIVEKEHLPVMGSFDTVIAGGGTAGACAAIASAREGSRTLVVEYLHGLGGMGTMGLIGRYWVGYRDGFTKEIDEGVAAMAPVDHGRQRKSSSDWVKDWKMEWYRSQILKAGGEVWFGGLCCGAVVEGNNVKGIVVATPLGKGVVLANNVIDATGSADVAIAAGAAYEFVDANSVALQGSGLPKVNPDDHYNNTDYTFIDDADVRDVTRSFIAATAKFSDGYDVGKLPQTRERRRMVGDYTVTAMDMVNERHYEDTLSYHYSSFDTHGYTVDPYFIIKPPGTANDNHFVHLPLRSLLPKGLNHIVVTGLGVSAQRDAMPIIRMQPCLQNQGFAVGYLAAAVGKQGVSFRDVNFSGIQKELVRMGILPESVLQGKDLFPPSESQLREAARAIGNNFDQLELILWNPQQGLNILKQEFDLSSDPHYRKKCAVVLGFYRFEEVAGVLTDAIAEYEGWDKGWNFRGMHQFGMSASYLDALIMSLGKSGSQQGFEQVSRLAGLLTLESELSHIRAISEALADMKHPRASELLHRLLMMPGVMGHSVRNYRQALFHTSSDVNDNSTRNDALRELFLARALLICGDYEELGRSVLQKYADDLCGSYSVHAQSLLNLCQPVRVGLK